MANIQEVAKRLGLTEKEVASYFKQVAYRKSYSARPEVQRKRKVYSKKRYEGFKRVAQAMKGVL